MRPTIHAAVPAIIRATPLAVLLSLSACVLIGPPRDPNAVAPEYDRWEARTPAAPSEVFARAMRVLADSGYLVRFADPSQGIIATNLRRTTINGSTEDRRLDLMILPDSGESRVIVRGEVCAIVDGGQRCLTIDAWSGEWRLVQGIGRAIVP